ncbi:cob(I)yrinic acid a,c-diamide adenosyltransferase [Candidatus Desulfosporosinus nitrosoreducens]|uniref:cob(I)yrinic acid a,c-diamide adenosyltransferase n=1 Tax=Candidatus Desulfosporosinus nitrosoreducens TaxID=3401928 RepID=UPI00280B2A14|nr:cob(I)yrinic acid a,c-diamide adenosyltransferase [Desulfosporosinus sp. PR]
MTGLVHIYTGEGKGKTTSAVGLAIRAVGNNLRVLMVQFLKGAETGETAILQKLEPNFKLCRAEETNFLWNLNGEQRRGLRENTEALLNYSLQLVDSEDWDVFIMDEVMGAILTGFISKKTIVQFLKNKPQKLEVVMTGSYAPKELIEMADYVSDITPVKHPFRKGIVGRKGIEF